MQVERGSLQPVADGRVGDRNRHHHPVALDGERGRLRLRLVDALFGVDLRAGARRAGSDEQRRRQRTDGAAAMRRCERRRAAPTRRAIPRDDQGWHPFKVARGRGRLYWTFVQWHGGHLHQREVASVACDVKMLRV
jgi:hypothetical protein